MACGLKAALVERIRRDWQQRGWLPVLLLPVTLFYWLLFSLRRRSFAVSQTRSKRLKCAVIVVGNVIVGGAGKTPTTIGIVRHLQGRGVKVGVVSRGYGADLPTVCEVGPATDATLAGDEPVLIARATQAPVFAASDRYAAGVALLAAHPETQVIVCDDGLQHYALWRDMEVCVFDDRGCGNGWLLPSGPLREAWPRKALASAGQREDRTLVLHTGATAAFGGYRAHRALADFADSIDGSQVLLSQVKSPLLAMAGIARPETFFSSLRARGLVLDKTLPLPDHFNFSKLDTATLRGYQVLCTEKDAVKLWAYWPQAMAVPLVQTLEPPFLQALDAMVDTVLAAKLSSLHGHQTA